MDSRRHPEWPTAGNGHTRGFILVALLVSLLLPAPLAAQDEVILDPDRPGVSTEADESDSSGEDDSDPSEEDDTDPSEQDNEAENPQPNPDAATDAQPAEFDETIVDPTRPGVSEPDPEGQDEEVIVDPTRPGSKESQDGSQPDEESIIDPTRPGSSTAGDSSPNGSGEEIVDPERPGSSGTAHGSKSTPAVEPEPDDSDDFMRIGYLVGRYRHLSSIDTGFENPHEDVLEFRNELSFGIRFDASAITSALIEARFTHWFTMEEGSEGQDFLDDADGTFNVELREAWLRFSFDEVVLTLGNQFILWGTTDIFSPTQVVHRRDFRYGVPFESTEDLIPIFALDVKWFAMDGLTLEAWLEPFFTTGRSQVFGNDFSIASPGSPLAATLGVAEVLDTVVDDNGGEAIDTAFQSFSTPDAAVENLSVGTRIAGSFSGIDLGAAYLFGWDDTPTLDYSDDLAVITRAILANPDVLQTLDPRPILLEPGVLQALANLQGQSIDSLLFSNYERLHTVALDFQTYIGPVGIRLEGTFNPNKTYLVLQDAEAPGGLFQQDEEFRQLDTARLGDLYGVLGLSWESADTRWFVSLEGFYRRLFGLDDSVNEDPLLGAQDLYGAGLGLRMEPVDGLEIQLGGLWTITFLEDFVLTSTISYEIITGLSVLARWVYFHGPNIEDEISIGSVYDNNDHVSLGLDWKF